MDDIVPGTSFRVLAMTRSTLLLRFGIVLLATSFAAGCSTFRRSDRVAYVERPVEQIYNEAGLAMDRRAYSDAVKTFDEVERQHPYSEWASRANLMAAFAHYQANDYTESIAAARRYIDLHPGNDETVYAYYLIAICYFEQIVDVGRDQGTTVSALDALGEVVRRYPNTEYAADARLKVDMVRDQLAGKEMEIGRWYLRRNQHLAALNRFKTVVDDYQTTTHTPEALYRLTESYLSVGLRDQALASASVLGYNYGDTQWYRDAYRLMNSEGDSIDPVAQDPDTGWLTKMRNRLF